MGAFLLSLITTLLALSLVTPRRRSRVDAPGDAGSGDGPRRRRRGVAAVVAADGSPDVQAVLAQLLDHLDRIVVVDAAGAGSAHLADFLGHPSIDVVPVPDGPGTAMARARCAGVQQAIQRHAPRAVLVVEPDAASAVELVPEFLAELAGHDAVVGDRTGPDSRMAGVRRAGARLVARLLGAVLRRPVRDAGCGMRLFSTEALRRVPLDTRGCASDVRHLKAMLARGLDVVWVPVPGPGGPRRGCGALPRALTVPAAIVAPVGLRAPGRRFWRAWGLRLTGAAAAVGVLAVLVPLLQPVDARLLGLIGPRIGDAPGRVLAALDPHAGHALTVLVAAVAAAVSGRARVAGTVLALAAAGTAAHALVEVVGSVDVRPRPEEAPAPSEIRASDPSGAEPASLAGEHAAVAIALAVAGAKAVPVLRVPFVAYAVVISWSAIAAGAGFPLDGVAAAALGLPCAAFGVALADATGVLRPLAAASPRGHPPRRPSR